MFYILLVLLLILVLIIPLEFHIENKGNDTSVYLKIAYIFRFYVDYSKIVKMFVTSKDDRETFSIREIIENSRKLKSAYPFIKQITHVSTLKKIRVINRFTDYDYSLEVANFATFSILSNHLHGMFGRVEKEEYYVSNEFEFDYDFLCISRTHLVNILIVLIENIRKVPLLLKRIT